MRSKRGFADWRMGTGLMKIRCCAAAAIAIALSGCAGGPPFVGREGLEVVQGGDLPPPTRQDLGTAAAEALIGPLDQLQVEVFGVAELTRSVQVDAGGRISLPLAGVIEAAGKTPQEVAAIVEDRLQGRYVRSPQVTVNVVNPVSQVFTVEGEVRDPGQYPVAGSMTLMRSIARAKGLTEFARINHVVVFRRVGNQDMAALYDLRAIRQGLYADPPVYANDVISVGDSQARRLFRDVLQASGLITTPIIALIQSGL